MIQRSGGKIADDLTVNTDFLVVGEEPPRPPKLADDASETDKALNDAQMKAYMDYEAAKAKAQAMYIPSLNTNRFLDLMGYVPDKK